MTITVKALEWSHFDNGNAYAGSIITTYFAHTVGTWCHRNGNFIQAGHNLEDAKAGAQADYDLRILSALSVPAEAVVGEPEPIGYCSEYGLDKLASQAHHYCLSVSKAQENEFQFPIYAAPSAPDGWQPIETAKMNDTFLAINAGSTERYDVNDPAAVVTVPCHNRAFICHSFEDEETGERCFIDEFGEQYGLDGRVSDAEDLTVADDVLRLTHWCPLPTPPALRSEKP